MDRQTLRDWVHRFNAAGPGGLIGNWTAGPKPRLSEEQRAQFAQIVEAGQDREKDGVVRWRRIDLCHDRLSPSAILQNLQHATSNAALFDILRLRANLIGLALQSISEPRLSGKTAIPGFGQRLTRRLVAPSRPGFDPSSLQLKPKFRPVAVIRRHNADSRLRARSGYSVGRRWAGFPPRGARVRVVNLSRLMAPWNQAQKFVK
jgi:hypothetical protein